MPSLKRFARSIAGLAAVVLGLAMGEARAQSEVIYSNVPSLPVGHKVADGAVITVPERGVVRLLLPDAKTMEVRGRFEGTVEDYKKLGARPATSSPTTGGVPGGTRGAAPRKSEGEGSRPPPHGGTQGYSPKQQ